MAVCRAGVRVGEMCGVVLASGIGRVEKDLKVLIIEAGIPEAGAESDFSGCWLQTAQMPSGLEEAMWGQRHAIKSMERVAGQDSVGAEGGRVWRFLVEDKIKRRENMVYRITCDMRFEVK